MQSLPNTKKLLSTREVKQVKVDNWGTFFLQRLLQLYFNEELLDLTIKFHSNDTVLKVHRLVIAACTDYFVKLEREQNMHNCSVNNVIFMPMDMPYECVKSIVSFMYTGQLEYWSTEQVILYRTAQKMNMSILTKLLDAQVNSNIYGNARPKHIIDKSYRSSLMKKSLHGSTSSTNLETENGSTVWKRKQDSKETFSSKIKKNYLREKSEGPSRFDLPEIEDLTLGVFSSFDDITYNTQPIMQAPITNTDDNIKSHDNTTFSDIILSFDDNEGSTQKGTRNYDSSGDEWMNTDILKFNKKESFFLKEFQCGISENRYTKKINNVDSIQSNIALESSVNNHAKIIREVLKKYPHLVQQNKNIRLKIMQKDSKNKEYSTAGRTKISYVILKSESLMLSDNVNNDSIKIMSKVYSENNETGPWKCCKCNLEENYIDYYMYRRHMQDVHDERFDPRICEQCGYKARKRNILMYHMYTKHNVTPPKNMSFPKCQICSYIALSEPLLSRHQINHKHQPILGMQMLPVDSLHCPDHEQNFKNTCKLINHENKLYETCCQNIQKNHSCLHREKYTVNIKNLKLNIDYRHKIKENTNLFSERPIISSSRNKALHHSPSGISSSVDINDTSLVMGENEKQIKKVKLSNIVSSDSQYNEQDIVTLVNDENYHALLYKDTYALRDFSNNQMMVENSNNKTIFCLQDNKNFHPLYNIGSNTSYENHYNSKKDIEEGIPEINTFEKKHEKSDTQLNYDEESCFKDINNSFSNSEELIQYIEEETEILEYDTCTNV